MSLLIFILSYCGFALLCLAMPKYARAVLSGSLSIFARQLLTLNGWLLLGFATALAIWTEGVGIGLVLAVGLFTFAAFTFVLLFTFFPHTALGIVWRKSTMRAHWFGTSFLPLMLVSGIHFGALLVIFWSPSSRTNSIELPAIQGVLIPAPPAEAVQLPSAKTAPPPEPPPVEPPPEPLPKPKPPEPKPKPEPQPEVKSEPSENALLEEPKEIEEAPPPVINTPSSVAANEDRNTLGAPVTPPRQDADFLNNPAPAYPTISRRLREQGVVVLEVLILPDGSVGDIRVEQSSGFDRLDETAIKAVKKWRYVPAKRGDEPIAYWYLQPVEFSLN